MKSALLVIYQEGLIVTRLDAIEGEIRGEISLVNEGGSRYL